MKFIDLFAGCGGLSLGLEQAGFKSIWTNEFDQKAAKTYATNFPHATVSTDDIRTVDEAAVRTALNLDKGQLDLIAGGFPCQGFSTYGQRKEDDERNQLYIDFIRFVSEFEPKCVLIENVVGLLSMSGGEVLNDIHKRLKEIGYHSLDFVLQAADFGVPQRRKRVFVVATKNGDISIPKATHAISPEEKEPDFFTCESMPYVTVKEAIGDLPMEALKPADANKVIEYETSFDDLSSYAKSMNNGSTHLLNHSAKQLLGVRKLRLILMSQGDYGRDLKKLDYSAEIPSELRNEIISDCGLRRPLEQCRKQDRAIEEKLIKTLGRNDLTFGHLAQFFESGGFANKYRRLNYDGLSHTLVAHMARDCSDFIHPTLNRFITVREAARLQSFGDSFEFVGSQFAQLKQIGNAVPPLLGKAIGIEVANALRNLASMD